MGSYRKVAMNGLIRFTILIEHVTGLYAKYKWNVFCPLISLLGLWAANLHPTTPPVQTHTHTPPDSFVSRVESTLLIGRQSAAKRAPDFTLQNSNAKGSVL